MERGTADGVAIRSDGRLETAPATSLLYTTNGSYVWSLTADAAGNAYLGRGGTVAGSAIVTQVKPDGTAADIFTGKELAVQALKTEEGVLFAATSPDGKVYRIETGKPGAPHRVVFDPAETSEKPKYLWDLAIGKAGELYVATGAPAAVYKVPTDGGKAELLFSTADQHIRCLLLAPDDTLYAGSDGAGVIYRIDPHKPGARPFAIYSAPRREITALAFDSGNLYAAGVGTKGSIPLPNLPVTGSTGVTITFVQPASAGAAAANTIVPEGSDIYKIASDGSPTRLLTLKDDVVYALAVRKGSLLAATGNRGRIYRVDTAVPGVWTDIAHMDAAQAMAFAPIADGLLTATSNNGRVFKLGDAGAKESTYISTVFDAQVFSKWGRAEILPASSDYEFYVRSGNVENPAMGWSDWIKAAPNSGNVGVPGARYVQWKATLQGSATIESVGLNYLAKNLAPVVDDIVALPGARVAPTPSAVNNTVQVNFPSAASSMTNSQQDASSSPLIAQKDKSGVTIRWAAHDDNGDDLLFAVEYKGEGEVNWRLMKDKITDRFYSFDAALLPDGTYTVKVIASDSPAHTDDDALTGEKASGPFVIDTTPPVPGTMTATIEGSRIHVKFDAKDASSPISHAEYSLDAGPWQYLEPAGGLSDSLAERYDFLAAIPSVTMPVTNAKEHVVAIRVYDRYENATTAKAVVR
jgi:hypothetical protein